jgi:hypothetical protein
MIVEEGTDLDQLPKESVFATSTITTTSIAPAAPPAAREERLSISKFLDDAGSAPRSRQISKVLAFGAQ